MLIHIKLFKCYDYEKPKKQGRRKQAKCRLDKRQILTPNYLLITDKVEDLITKK